MKTITENTVQAGQGRMNIKEIARVAGVSPATISRVLNGSGYVKEETKKKVMAAVEKNNYTPSLIARSLSGRDSFSIGVILPSASQRVYSGILEGICRLAQPFGYNIVLMNTGGDIKKQHEFLEAAENQRMKGLIVAPAASDGRGTRDKLLHLEEQGMPVILTEGNIKGAPFDCVFGDNWRGAYEGAESLMDAGHKKIAVIREKGNFREDRERFRGFMQAMEDHGLEVSDEYVIYNGESGAETADAIARLLEENTPPTALFALSGEGTCSCMKCLERKGLTAGEDLGFMGFDDQPVLYELGYRLSVVERDAVEQGREAMRLLQERFDEKEQERRIGKRVMVPCRLILRGSGNMKTVTESARKKKLAGKKEKESPER